MKNLKTLFAIGGMALLTACGTPKETTSTSVNTNRGRSTTETNSKVAVKASEGSRTIRGEASANTANARNTEATEKAKLKRMYTDLEMTNEQIIQFENEWKRSMESWKRSNRGKEMNNYERVEYQDKILRDVLNDSQYESYRDWVRKNAGKN